MATTFIHDDFLLQTPMARRLYHEVAAGQPIIDYHCHLPPEDIAVDRRFRNLFEIWLEGDHYKWRAMRSNGVAEEFCTGDAEPYAKFLAFAETVPMALRNPLYHWCHLELKRYFGVDELLDASSAPGIWELAEERLAQPDRRVSGILDAFKVEVICTTDDPADDLSQHEAIAAAGGSTKVAPAYRPDAACQVGDPVALNAYLDRLGEAADVDISSYHALEDALRKRHDYFHERGCRLSDHGLAHAPAVFRSDREVEAVFQKLRSGSEVSAEDGEALVTAVMLFTGRLDAEKGWVNQLHLGPMRNNNTRAFKTAGRDAGFDSMGDWPQAEKLSRFLDRLDEDDRLPKTVIYNLNPADNYVMGSMIGNFQDGSVAGKIQFGSGWWFLDQKEGMEMQINALSNLGLLSRFVGMLTDSRSFMSFPRHEYFRRILCNLLGDDAARGEVPDDFETLANLVRAVCYENARDYFPFVAEGQAEEE